MYKMAAIVLFATATALALPAQASAHHRHRTHHHAVRSDVITCDRQGCRDQVASAEQPHVAQHRTRSSRGCPPSLGCGCNLANALGGLSRFGSRVWRKLWQARAWAHEGAPAAKGCTDCVAVLTRRGGGHVGIVKGYDGNGNPVIYSYANARLGWTTVSYSARRVIAYRKL